MYWLCSRQIVIKFSRVFFAFFGTNSMQYIYINSLQLLQHILSYHEHAFEDVMRGMLFQEAEKEDIQIVPDIIGKPTQALCL